MRSKSSVVLLALCVVFIAVVLLASACGGEPTTAISGSATTIQVMTTAAGASTTGEAPTLESYRTQMKALWAQYGPTLHESDMAMDIVDPGNLTDAELQGSQKFTEALNGLVSGLKNINPPAEVAEAHATYLDIVTRLAAMFNQFLTAATGKDAAGSTAALTSIATLYTQEGEAMSQAKTALENALGFALSGDTSSTDTTVTPALGSDAKTYTDPTYGYTFQYPARWAVHDGATNEVNVGAAASSGAGAYDPNGATANGAYIDYLTVSTYPLSATLTDADIPNLQGEIETALAGTEGQGADMTVVSPLAQTEVAGLKGYTVTYTFDKDGTPATSTLYFLFKGDMEYQVTIQAATDNWQKNQATFAAMVASFTAP